MENKFQEIIRLTAQVLTTLKRSIIRNKKLRKEKKEP